MPWEGVWTQYAVRATLTSVFNQMGQMVIFAFHMLLAAALRWIGEIGPWEEGGRQANPSWGESRDIIDFCAYFSKAPLMPLRQGKSSERKSMCGRVGEECPRQYVTTGYLIVLWWLASLRGMGWRCPEILWCQISKASVVRTATFPREVC